MRVEIFFDGACHNLKGESSAIGMGVAVYINGEYEEELSRAWGYLPNQLSERGTSNVAEWHACVEAFRIAKSIKSAYAHSIIKVYSDSQIITRQFNGQYTINHDNLKQHKHKAHEHSHGCGCREIIWIPREKNKIADILSKEGLRQAKNK